MPKVDICLFSYRRAPTDSLMALLNGLIPFTKQNGVECGIPRVYGNALVHASRNKALAESLYADPTHVLFCDDDMLPESNAILRLLQADKPVVSALCTTRSYADLKFACKVYNPEKDVFGQISDVRRDRVITGPFAPGTGFLLMDRPTIEALIEYHLSGQDWMDDFTRVLSRMSVRSENREKQRVHLETLRRRKYANTREFRVFDFPVNDQDDQMGEDICLGRKLLKLGIPVSIDGTTPVGHIGDYPYGAHDIDAQAN